jgi:hypothetical protein
VWARLHKIDRIRPRPGGDAIVLIEDERNVPAMARVPSLSKLMAIARVLNARRALDAKYGGKGEIRYAAAVAPPEPLVDAITRAGASITDARGERITVPASPASVAATVDQAFAELAHHVRTGLGAPDMITALRRTEAARRASPLDRDANPAAYWTAVLELAALAGELSRSRGGRWIDTTDLPVPYALAFPDHKTASPARLAQRIVDGEKPEETLATP